MPAPALEPRDSTLEDEIVGLFDLLREPLLRYLASLGLPMADGEEIVQEVFLSLFQHLRRGGDRTNLRGWVFRVAHNLGLKRRSKTSRLSTIAWEWLCDPAPGPAGTGSQVPDAAGGGLAVSRNCRDAGDVAGGGVDVSGAVAGARGAGGGQVNYASSLR